MSPCPGPPPLSDEAVTLPQQSLIPVSGFRFEFFSYFCCGHEYIYTLYMVTPSSYTVEVLFPNLSLFSTLNTLLNVPIYSEY